MALIDDVKERLRTNLTDEVSDLIDTAKARLKLIGILPSKVDESDPLIKSAIIFYCKANFGYEDPSMSEKFQKTYDMIETSLSLSTDYIEVS